MNASRLRPVYLDDFDGYQFEELCCKILDILGYGTIHQTPKSGDAGKDIIIVNDGKTVFVECKHWVDTPIGRPEIQKLHSAIVSEGASAGIFITTGRMSRHAEDYANGLVPKILLIDGVAFTEMAKEAGYNVIYGNIEFKRINESETNPFISTQTPPIYYFKLSQDITKNRDKIIDYLSLMNYNDKLDFKDRYNESLKKKIFSQERNMIVNNFKFETSHSFLPFYMCIFKVPVVSRDSPNFGELVMGIDAPETLLIYAGKDNEVLRMRNRLFINQNSNKEGYEPFLLDVEKLDAWSHEEAIKYGIRFESFKLEAHDKKVNQQVEKTRESYLKDGYAPETITVEIHRLMLPIAEIRILPNVPERNGFTNHNSRLFATLGPNITFLTLPSCSMDNCSEFANACPLCGNYYCMDHRYYCTGCRREVCESCAHLIMEEADLGFKACQCKECHNSEQGGKTNL